MPSTYLYAEFLSNIRQVTLYAALKSYKNDETKVQLSSNRKSISLSHDGETATILLPTEISGTAQLTIPVHQAKELSFRLQVADATIPPRSITSTDNEVPWSADSLDVESQVRCRTCTNLIVAEGRIRRWKDLPSEYWAEMMDFWHCHKPHDHGIQNGDGHSMSKGYAAATKVTAGSGIGLVDISSFLFAEEDCHGLQVSASKRFNGSRVLECQTCESMVGVVDRQSQGWKLQKWSLSVKTSGNAQLETVPACAIISLQLLSLIDAQVVRKFVVHQGKDTEDSSAFVVWVFNPDLRYSSSVKPDVIARAMKIFYRPIVDAEIILKEHSMEYEELCLPRNILHQFRDELQLSSKLLPDSARKFQEWDVGLLDRYEES